MYMNGQLRYAETAKGKEGEIYSCDKVQLVFRLRYGEGQGLLDALAAAYWMEFDHRESRKQGSYRNQFSVKVGEGLSFWLGVGLTTPAKPRPTDGAKLEYNPNKVGGCRALLWLLAQLWQRAKVREACVVKAWDLAVDYPLPREALRMQRDARLYEEYTRSASDTTQYVGQRNAPGRCKLYNKTVESRLDAVVTRLELTLAGGATPADVADVWPVVYQLADVQTTTTIVALNDTDRFIFSTLLKEPDRIRELGRRKRAVMAALLSAARYTVKPDLDAVGAVCRIVERLAERHTQAQAADAVPGWQLEDDGQDFVPIVSSVEWPS